MKRRFLRLDFTAFFFFQCFSSCLLQDGELSNAGGVTQFSALLPQECRQNHLGLKPLRITSDANKARLQPKDAKAYRKRKPSTSLTASSAVSHFYRGEREEEAFTQSFEVVHFRIPKMIIAN
ncbi:hypothetical protein NE237_000380 [Protea cynaroides]|uniref:Secreted protein n=1 Tax=Protea cynaroides TaxID=273540 RepID=A0A9Q0KRF8_9MAGN|nr:hypothetical protein NE237_000380 [Protea cynaroides]